MTRLRQYVIRWTRWLLSALDELVFRKGGVKRYWIYVLIKLQIRGIDLPQSPSLASFTTSPTMGLAAG